MTGRDIAFVLFPKFSMIALFGAVEPLRVANRFAGRVFSWRFVSLDGEPVFASNDIPVSASARLADIGTPDMAVLCASYEPERSYTPATASAVRRLARRGVVLGGIDTGPFMLAEAGVLDGYRATCHWESLPGFRESYPAVAVTSALYEIDRGRLTCAGGSAAIDMMLDYIARACDRSLAIKVADQLVHSRLGDPAGEARLPARVRYQVDDPRLVAVIEAMEQNMEEPLGLDELTRVGGLSLRQMERLFTSRLAMPPTRFYRRLRLERAEWLITYSRLSVTDVALACGFPSLAQFSRAYRAVHGIAPSRQRFAARRAGLPDRSTSEIPLVSSIAETPRLAGA